MRTFLEQSSEFLRAVTEYFHLVNTSRTAQVVLVGEIQEIIEAGEDDRVISARFPLVDGATGQNLRAYALRESSENDRYFAEMWLFAVFSRYEAWAESLEVDCGLPGGSRGCQFPSSSNAPNFHTVFEALAESQYMVRIFGSTSESCSRFVGSALEIDTTLLAYRCFKEMRNCLIHAGGGASERLLQAWGKLHDVLGDAARAEYFPSSLDLSKLTVGEPIIVTFGLVRDAIEILQRLVVSLDRLYMLSELGEINFKQRWRAIYGSAPMPVNARKADAPDWLKNRVTERIGVPLPVPGAGELDKPWPPDARLAFREFALENWLIRKVF